MIHLAPHISALFYRKYNFEQRRSAAPVVLKNLRFKVLFFKNVIIKQLQRQKKKEKQGCTAESVAETN